IGLKDSSVSFEMALGVIASSVARVEEHGCRRIMTPERAIVPNIDPRPPARRLAFGQHRYRGVIAVHAAAGNHERADAIVERAQKDGAAANLIGLVDRLKSTPSRA